MMNKYLTLNYLLMCKAYNYGVAETPSSLALGIPVYLASFS